METLGDICPPAVPVQDGSSLRTLDIFVSFSLKVQIFCVVFVIIMPNPYAIVGMRSTTTKSVAA